MAENNELGDHAILKAHELKILFESMEFT